MYIYFIIRMANTVPPGVIRYKQWLNIFYLVLHNMFDINRQNDNS